MVFLCRVTISYSEYLINLRCPLIQIKKWPRDSHNEWTSGGKLQKRVPQSDIVCGNGMVGRRGTSVSTWSMLATQGNTESVSVGSLSPVLQVCLSFALTNLMFQTSILTNYQSNVEFLPKIVWQFSTAESMNPSFANKSQTFDTNLIQI